MQEIWVAGQVKLNARRESTNWDFQGVFDSREKAIKACINWRYFIAPAILNEELPDEWQEWEGAYYPNQNITWKEYWRYFPLKAIKVKLLRFFKVDI